jgi:glucose uptake protein
MFVSSFVLNIFFMNLPVEGEPVEFTAYFKGGFKQHLAGLAGGVIFYLGLLSGMVATSVQETLQPSQMVRIILSHGSPVVAALLGVVLWRELKDSDMRVKILTALMIMLFLGGLAMIGLAPMYLRAS